MAESEAFDELYRSSRGRLARQIVALTGDPNEAADLVQEAFVRAWSHWNRIASYDDPEAWVRRVAYHLAVGGWRRSRRLVLRSDVGLDATEPPEEHVAVLVALRSLPVRERQTIVMHYLADRSVEETAFDLSVPVGTVKSWLSRGRTRLAQKLNQYDEVSHDP